MPTRWNGSNFSPTVAPCELRVCQCLAPGLPGERRDIAFRLGHRRPQGFVGLERGGHQFGLGDGQLVRAQPGAVEALGQFQQSRIAARPHVIQDGPRPLLDGRVEQAGGGGQFAQSLGEIGVGVANDVHAATRLEQGPREVKIGVSACCAGALQLEFIHAEPHHCGLGCADG